jgi:hypothetical protein
MTKTKIRGAVDWSTDTAPLPDVDDTHSGETFRSAAWFTWGDRPVATPRAVHWRRQEPGREDVL